MKLKTILFTGMTAVTLFTACKKSENLTSLTKSKNAVSFSAVNSVATANDRLIAYKNSPHKLTVGYFNQLEKTGDLNFDHASLLNVPDSVDIVDVFATIDDTNKDMLKKKAIIQKDIKSLRAKGTQVVVNVWLSRALENFKKDGKTKYKNNDKDYAIWAKQVYDYYKDWDFDGIDIDMEDGLFPTDAKQLQRIYNALSKYFGPKSGTGKLFIVDTNVDANSLSNSGLSKDFVNANLNYIFIQDYFGSEDGTDSKIDGYTSNGYPFKNIMDIAADFESSYNSSSTDSGPLRLKKYYTNSEYINKVGGFGAYGLNYDQKQKNKYTRAMIQTLNPAKPTP